MAAGKCIKHGSMRICRDKKGQFARLLSGGIKRRKKATKKGAKCVTKPRMRKGRCSCKTKTGANKFVKKYRCKRK